MMPLHQDLTETPDIDSLAQASERAPLSILAAAALCTRNALIATHKAELLATASDWPSDSPTPAVTLVAMRVTDCIDELMESLLLYDATLRDTLRVRLDQDMPF